jgi:hypothetical protein
MYLDGHHVALLDLVTDLHLELGEPALARLDVPHVIGQLRGWVLV